MLILVIEFHAWESEGACVAVFNSVKFVSEKCHAERRPRLACVRQVARVGASISHRATVEPQLDHMASIKPTELRSVDHVSLD